MGESVVSLTCQAMIYCAKSINPHEYPTNTVMRYVTRYKGNYMSQHYAKLLAIEETKYKAFQLLKLRPMCVPELMTAINMKRPNVQGLVGQLVKAGSLMVFLHRNPISHRMVNFYKSTGKEYVKKTEDDFYEYFSHKAEKHAHKWTKDENKPIVNSHVRIVRNLDRPGSDYAWQRPKRKSTTVNIGSTFSLYDSATL